jgi:hypothetical protein
MKRRNFNLLAGTSLLALMASGKRGFADMPDPSLLKTTLTPMGSERAGNAAGTIPAWTGGMTEIPAGFNWDPTQTLPPDFFASDAMLYKVDASNMAQYADLLSEGVQTLMKNKGFYINVYPTHRTQAMPQWVYDNIALNISRTTPQNGDWRLGWNGAYGGYPFPIPASDPLAAGYQICYNNEARWVGPYQKLTTASYTNENGTAVLTEGARLNYRFGFYQQSGSPATYSGYFYDVELTEFGPATAAGDQAVGRQSGNPTVYPDQSWELLNGQGRVRMTPNLLYDTPTSYTDGIVNYDEYFGFSGPLNRYDCRLKGKKEMLIPYNNNKVFTGNSAALHTANFFDPEYIRWELHRVWVVECTLHPGERNVLARRMLYFDEDTWQCGIADAWDGAGNMLRVHYTLCANFPNLPGTIWQDSIAYNLQTGQYVSTGGSFADAPYNEPWLFDPIPDAVFEPQSMAASASY